MIDKRDVGEWVRIRIWDHCLTPERSRKKSPILCEVSGMIRAVTPLKIVLAHWWVHGEAKSVQTENAEYVELARVAIIEYGWCPVLVWKKDH